jgi:serralysin
MAKAGNREIYLSGNQDIDGILWGYGWNTQVISYSFPSSDAAYAGYESIGEFAALNTDQTAAVERVLDSVSSFTNLSFVRDNASTDTTLRFGRATANDIGDGKGSEGLGIAEAHSPDSETPAHARGDVWFNANLFLNPQAGSFAYSTFLHEIGHSLGLKHGQRGNEDHVKHGQTFPELPYHHNSSEYSVMTYWQYVGDHDEASTQQDLAQSYMQNDIAALQYMYGANYNFNSGNTTYRFSTTTGEMFVDSQGQGTPVDREGLASNTVFRTIWDGGGNDTYDLSNYAADLRVDLNPGAWITLDRAQLADLGDGHIARGNVANALLFQGNNASLIENAIGGSGNDALIGNDVANRLEGRGGRDVFLGGRGADTMIGGQGDDIYYVEDAGFFLPTPRGGTVWFPGDSVIENAGEGIDIVYASVNEYTLTANVETLVGRIDGDFRGTGNALANNLFGSLGNDVLDGRAGADSMQGDRGNDTYIVDNAGDAVVEGVNAGTDLVKTTLASYTLGANVEKLTYTGIANFSGVGNALANALAGGSAHDTLDGGAGVDTLSGGLGNDTYIVDNVGDSVVEGVNAGTDLVRTTLAHYTLGANVENLTFSGGGNHTGIGNALANTMYGNSGNDVLNGRDGADMMAGGAGNDTYHVNTSGDLVIEKAGAGTDTVIAATSHTLAANVENLTLSATTSFGVMRLTGNALDNVIVGSRTNDRLDGGQGIDVLTGDAPSGTSPFDPGAGLPSGSASNDTFVFHLGEANGDIVMDFWGAGDTAGDRLELSGYGEGMIRQVGKTDYYIITPDEAHGGFLAAETIRLAGVFDLDTRSGSNDVLFA